MTAWPLALSLLRMLLIAWFVVVPLVTLAMMLIMDLARCAAHRLLLFTGRMYADSRE